MSIWRSPVFYFGISLLMVVGLLLVAPFVMDWNAYKSNLEAYGQRLTGREVTIAGDIEVRLFPWPRLTADNVSVANPVDITGPDLIAVEQVTLSLALGALLNGTLSVESVMVSQPRITLVRTEEGLVNWMVKSDENLRSSTLLSQVRLDQIRLSSGTVRLEDRLRGVNATLTSVDSDMSAQTIEGPWKMKGSAFLRDVPLEFSFTTSTYDTSEPFKFGLRVTPIDTVMPTVVIDGGWDGVAFDGSLRVVPQEGESQKGSVEGGLRPLTLSSALRVTAERADLKDIRIAPADVADSGTLIEGSAALVLGEVTDAEVQLKAPRINLDTLVGAETLSTWRSGGVLALANGIIKQIPESMSGRFGLNVTVLTTGGASLENVEVVASLSPEGIQLERAKAGLPGRSTALLTNAMILRRDGAAEFSGPVAFESNDTRAFAMWAMPQHKAVIEQWWKGSRGRLKFAAETAFSGSQLSLTKMDYELDGQPGKANVVLRLGAVPAIDAMLATPSLDLDSYLARNAASFSKSRMFDALAVLQPLLSGNDTLDTHVKLDAGQLTLNGVSAQNVAFDVTTSRSGLEIKSLNIGSVGGATLKAEGLVLSKPEGPSGEVTARLAAEDPAAFLRLIGVASADSRWPRSLGLTDVGFTLRARPEEIGPQIDYTLQGRSGPFTLNFSGTLADLERGADAQVSMAGDVATDDASRLLPFLGLQPKQSAVGRGDVKLGFSGSRAIGFASSATLKAFGVNLAFDGMAKPQLPFNGLSGQVNLQTGELQPLLGVLGVPVSQGPQGAMRLAFKIAPDTDGLSISDVVGDHGGMPLAGTGRILSNGALEADVELGRIDMLPLMAMVFTPWDGGGFDAGRRFAAADDLPVSGEIWLRPKTLVMPFAETISDAAVGLTLGQTRQVKLLAPTVPDVEFSVSVAPSSDGFAVTAEGRVALLAEQMMRYADGTVLSQGRLALDGKLQGSGRSPGAVLAALVGQGTYKLTDFALSQLAPDVFAKRLNDVKSATDLASAFGVLEASQGLTLAESTGSFAMKDGAFLASPIAIAGTDAATTLTLSGDAIARTVALVAEIKIPTRSELPSVLVTYSGEPAEITKRSSTSQMAATLGHALLARDLAALEKLKQQQEVLARQEESQRLDDVAKFEAYQAQRSELRQRQRELKVFALLRERKEIAAKKFMTKFVAEGDSINRVELARQRLALGLKDKLANWKLENADLAQKAKRDEAQRQRLEAQDAKRIADEFKRDEAKRKADAKLKPVEEPVLVFPDFKIEAAPVPAPLPVPEALEDNSLY